MNILLIGQCTLHWGRMEFGNIGNYYIIEPMIREIRNIFPDCNIKTTFQMSERFSRQECVEILPMSLYYSWDESDLETALKELEIARYFNENKVLLEHTDYINEVIWADLVIDFSGDIWGDNANLLGKDRFLIGLIKDRVSQLLRKKTVMIAGSPGPFTSVETVNFAKEVYSNFDLVTNRESLSAGLLESYGFDISKTYSFACPAFLFEPEKVEKMTGIIQELELDNKDRINVGFILCGWNFEQGPFDKWPRDDSEYEKFAEVIEELGLNNNIWIYLMSHSNGFPIPPKKFILQHGRDYLVIKQLERVLLNRGKIKNFSVVEQVLDAWATKAVISNFDLLVSGRIHGAVAGLSTLVPTVIIDYGHEPKAHKLKGFAIEADVLDYVVEPNSKHEMTRVIQSALDNLYEYRKLLHVSIPMAKAKARKNFSILKSLFV